MFPLLEFIKTNCWNELLWAVMLLFNFSAILVVYHFYGKKGLFFIIPVAAIVANIQVLKEIELFGFTATLGNIVYASTFLITDILNENHGRKDARRAIVIGFIALFMMTVLMNLALLFKPGTTDWAHPHLESLFSFMPQITFASFVAYLVSQFHDIMLYSFLKKKLPSKVFIFVRNNVSTFFSQLIDSFIFTFIAFWGNKPFEVMIVIFISTFLIKVIVTLFDTPFIYISVWMHNKRKLKA